MAARRGRPRKVDTQPMVIQNCSIQMGVIHTKESAEAVIALANAAQENARAITQIAKLFSGEGVNMGDAVGIKVS
jgi:mannitol/fructose-specific phosphotransferase system IIA component